MKFKIPERLKSRKLWLALIAAFVAFGNAYWKLGLSEEQVTAIVLPLLGFIVAEGAVDTARALKE